MDTFVSHSVILVNGFGAPLVNFLGWLSAAWAHGRRVVDHDGVRRVSAASESFVGGWAVGGGEAG